MHGKLGKPFKIVTGAHEVRLAAAVKACDTVIDRPKKVFKEA